MAASDQSCGEIKLPITNEEEDKKVVKLIQRAQWLRAAILGANDGLLSTTSLMLGVGAAKEDQRSMIISGLAGALAGACSMAVGEFTSVSTQREIEQKAMDKSNSDADNSNNKSNIHDPSPVSSQFFSPGRSPFVNIISTTREDEGTEDQMLPNPYKAAGASACAFLCGSLVPILTALVFSHHKIRVGAIVVVTSIALAVFGATGARLGGSSAGVSALRVLLGGLISMGVTYSLLMPFDRDDDKGQQDVD